jgi:outer membrane protein assembly factor BamB
MQASRTKSTIFIAIFLLCNIGLFSKLAHADDWPQWRGPQRDGVWRESGIVEKFSSPQLPIKWRAEIGPGYSGPTVAKGRVYVTDRLVEPTQIERVHCFDAADGKPLWNYQYECPYDGVGYSAGPRASVLIDEGHAYSLGGTAMLYCFDAAKGDVLWHKNLKEEYKINMPIWGIAASPLIDGNRLILTIGGKHACVIALNKTDGKELWKALDDPAQYSAPILIQQAGRPVLVVWTAAAVVGLDPANGNEYWREEFKPTQRPIGIITPVTDGKRLFVSSFYDGSLMLKLTTNSTGQPAVERMWRKLGPDEQHTQSLHCVIGTPILDGDYLYGVDSYGQLRCLDANTGERIWEDLTAVPKARWSTIHMVRHGERVLMFNERGELLFARLSPQGFQELSRTKLIEPTTAQLDQRGGVCWSHPALANRHIFARNDKELVCASLIAE